MYIEVAVFFVIFQFIPGKATNATSLVGNVSATRKSKLAGIQQRVDLTRTRINSLETILQEQLATQRNGLKKEMKNLETSLSTEPFLKGYSEKFSNQEMCPNSCANLPGLCTTFRNQSFICECGPLPNNTQQTTTQTSSTSLASTDTTPTTLSTSTEIPSTKTSSAASTESTTSSSTTAPTTSTETTTPSTTTTPTTSSTPSTTTTPSTVTTPSTTTTPTISTETTTKPTEKLPTNCEEAINQTGRYGDHKIQCGDIILTIICLKGGDETGLPNEPDIDQWVVIQRRRDDNENFNRSWADYKKGFGDRDSDFWIGLDMINAMTHNTQHKLWIKLKTFEGEAHSGIYTDFGIGDEKENYVLKSLGNFEGELPDFRDSLIEVHLNQKFSTWDRDNDNKPEYNCAELYNGGWWFNKCHDSHLNGLYLQGVLPERDPVTNRTNKGHGISWKNWKWRLYSYKYAHMAVRPNMKNAKSFNENYCS